METLICLLLCGATWTGADGTTLEGEILSYNAGTVDIRSAGFAPKSLPIDWFRAEDRLAIRKAECKNRFRKYAEKKTGLSTEVVEGYWKKAQDNARKVKPDLEAAVKYYAKMARKNKKNEYAKTQLSRAEKSLDHCKRMIASPLSKVDYELYIDDPPAPEGLVGPFVYGRRLTLVIHKRQIDAYYHTRYGLARPFINLAKSQVGQMGQIGKKNQRGGLKEAARCQVVAVTDKDTLHCSLNGRRFAVTGVSTKQYKDGDTLTLTGFYEVMRPVNGTPVLSPLSPDSVKKSAKPARAPLDVSPVDAP